MTRAQIIALIGTLGAVAIFIVMVLFWSTLWPLLILAVAAGGLYLIGTKTDFLKKLFPPRSTDEDSSDENEDNRQKNLTWGNHQLMYVSLVTISVIGVVGWVLLLTFAEPVTNAAGEVTFSWARLWFWSVIAYAVFSYRFWAPVPTGKQAALTFFGKPIANADAGAPYAPLFVIQLIIETAATPQREFPAEPELIDRTELKDGYVIPAGKRPPLRIQFRNSISEEQARKLFGEDFHAKRFDGDEKGIDFVADVPTDGSSEANTLADGLSRRVTAEVQHVARIRVDNPSLFVTNVPPGETGERIDEAFRQIEDEAVKVLNQYFTRMSVAQALINIRWISIHLQNAVDERVGATSERRSWGVDVQAAFVKLIHTDHGINTAISEAAQAPFEKSKTIIDAEAEEVRLTLEGKGKASAAFNLKKRTLDGQAAGTKKLADMLNVTGAEAQAAEVARSIGEGGNTVVLGASGFEMLPGLAAAALGKSKKESAKPADTTNTQEEGDNS